MWNQFKGNGTYIGTYLKPSAGVAGVVNVTVYCAVCFHTLMYSLGTFNP